MLGKRLDVRVQPAERLFFPFRVVIVTVEQQVDRCIKMQGTGVRIAFYEGAVVHELTEQRALVSERVLERPAMESFLLLNPCTAPRSACGELRQRNHFATCIGKAAWPAAEDG